MDPPRFVNRVECSSQLNEAMSKPRLIEGRRTKLITTGSSLGNRCRSLEHRARLQRRQRLPLGHVCRFGSPATNPTQEGRPRDALHRDEPNTSVLMQLVERDQVGVRHPGENAKLVLDSKQPLAVEMVECLERDHFIPDVVEHLEDVTGATAAESTTKLEAGWQVGSSRILQGGRAQRPSI